MNSCDQIVHSACPCVTETAFSHALQYCTQRGAIFTSVFFSMMCESLLPLISSVCGVCPPKDTSDNPKTNYACHHTERGYGPPLIWWSWVNSVITKTPLPHHHLSFLSEVTQSQSLLVVGIGDQCIMQSVANPYGYRLKAEVTNFRANSSLKKLQKS